MSKFRTVKHEVREISDSDRLWKKINTVLLATLALFIAGLLFYPIDVIRDESWNITIEGPTHVPGSVINVSSTYEKVRNVEGIATRYIDCQNSEGAFVRYEINGAEANRVKGVGGTGIVLPIPAEIPTPTKCKVAIQVKYKIFSIGPWTIRSVKEYRESKTFDLITLGQVSVPSTLPAGPNQTQPRIPNSSGNSTPQTSTPATDIPVATSPQLEQPTPEPEPSKPIEILPTICLPLTNICINQ